MTGQCAWSGVRSRAKEPAKWDGRGNMPLRIIKDRIDDRETHPSRCALGSRSCHPGLRFLMRERHRGHRRRLGKESTAFGLPIGRGQGSARERREAAFQRPAWPGRQNAGQGQGNPRHQVAAEVGSKPASSWMRWLHARAPTTCFAGFPVVGVYRRTVNLVRHE